MRPVSAGNSQENSAACFSWLGSIPYILTGKHDFNLTPRGDSAQTQFSQHEVFTGLLSPLGAFFDPKLNLGWGAFNEDLKSEAERVWAEKQRAGQ